MNNNKPNGGTTVAGCLMAVWQLFIILPMWLFLLFTILNACGDKIPEYAWMLFWAYIPCCFISGILQSIYRVVANSDS